MYKATYISSLVVKQRMIYSACLLYKSHENTVHDISFQSLTFYENRRQFLCHNLLHIPVVGTQQVATSSSAHFTYKLSHTGTDVYNIN